MTLDEQIAQAQRHVDSGRARLYSRRQRGAPGARTRSPRMRVTILSQAVDTSFDRQSSPGAFFPVEPVFTDTRLRVGASEPDGAAAPQRRITGREDDLFVGSHAQHFVTHDQRAAGEFLRSVFATSRHLRGLAELIDLLSCRRSASNIVSCLGSFIAENEIQNAAFEPFARRIAAATGFRASGGSTGRASG